MPECQHCGSHVSNDFVRVFGNSNGVVHGCIECGTKSRMAEVHKDNVEHKHPRDQ